MRVIAGTARRIPLSAPKGMTTRPTSDRAKESLFNILAGRISDARFLDLFCGSGAIGIEALSRGASAITFVDNSKFSQTAVSENLGKTKMNQSEVQILRMNASSAIRQLNQAHRQYDIIFLDPPYDMRGTNFLAETLQVLADTALLAKDGLLIAETDTRTGAKFANDDLQLPFIQSDMRTCGQTCFLFFEWGGVE